MGECESVRVLMPKRDGKEIRCRSTTLLKIAWNEGDEKSGRGMDGWTRYGH